MYRYADTQEQLPKRQAWRHKDSGVSYCRRALENATSEELADIGIEYVPDPDPVVVPESIESRLQRSDHELIMVAARMLEDIADERIAEGKYVSLAVSEKIAERKALRAQL